MLNSNRFIATEQKSTKSVLPSYEHSWYEPERYVQALLPAIEKYKNSGEKMEFQKKCGKIQKRWKNTA